MLHLNKSGKGALPRFPVSSKDFTVLSMDKTENAGYKLGTVAIGF